MPSRRRAKETKDPLPETPRKQGGRQNILTSFFYPISISHWCLPLAKHHHNSVGEGPWQIVWRITEQGNGREGIWGQTGKQPAHTPSTAPTQAIAAQQKVPSREGKGTPLQYSCLESPMDRGAWWAAVHGVARSQTRLSDFTFTFHSHALEKEMATHSSVLAWRIPGLGSLLGCCLWGRTESDTTEAT